MGNLGNPAIRLSIGPANPSWSIAVFAHNEERDIGAALDSIGSAANGVAVDIVVIANGCSDRTKEIVLGRSKEIPNLWLLEIGLGDKANAWNAYVYDVIPSARTQPEELFFFMDADCVLGSKALEHLFVALRNDQNAQAAGAMPATGRSQKLWRKRMVEHCVLAGGLYALRGDFVRQLRASGARMPIGLIGEDLFISWLAATDIGSKQEPAGGANCVFSSDARFFFRSLSPWVAADYGAFFWSKWRYTIRALQYQMVVQHLIRHGIAAMPKDESELYRFAPLPSRFQWAGVYTPLRFFAVLWIRTFRK